QRAARPAIVNGRPAQDPIGESEPPSPTSHPKMLPESASIAYRNLPSAVRSSSRRPGRPSTVSAAVASSSARLPSAPIAYLDSAPSAKLVVKAYRSSLVTTAQQISLRPLPNERVTGVSEPPRTAYDEVAASPLPARNASVTIRVPPLVKANPYGVGPDDGVTVISPSRPSAATANVMIESVARSVMTSIEPSGVNPICAGSAFAADSG